MTNKQYDISLKLSPPARLQDGTFHAKLDKKYNRCPHANDQIEGLILSLWEQKLARHGDNLWNATKFRLAGVQGRTVQLGITDYRAHQGTTLAQDDPLQIFGEERHLANALGNACVVVTKDGYVPFLRRSNAVGEGAGMMALPGGHAEPSKLGISSIEQFEEESAPFVAQEALMHELFDSIVQEVVEELHIPQEHLDTQNALMLGLVRRLPNMRYQLVMELDCLLTKAQITAMWQRGTELEGQRAESFQIVFVALSDLNHVVATGQVPGGTLMSEHWGAVELYMCVRQPT